MNIELFEILVQVKLGEKNVARAHDEILSLMGENKNPITGEGADNKGTDNG